MPLNEEDKERAIDAARAITNPQVRAMAYRKLQDQGISPSQMGPGPAMPPPDSGGISYQPPAPIGASPQAPAVMPPPSAMPPDNPENPLVQQALAKLHAPPAPVQHVPAQYVPVHRQIQHGLDLSEAQTALDAGQGLHLESAQRAEEAGRARAAFEMGHAQQVADIQRDNAAKQQAIQKEKDDYVTRHLQELENSQREIESQKIDPDQIWHEKGGGAKMLAALSMGLGAIGAGLTRGPNYAMQIVDNQIQNSIRAQEQNIENSRRGLADKTNLFARNLEKFKDRGLAQTATTADLLQAATSQLDSQLAGVKDQDMLARGAEMKASLMDKYAQEKAKFTELSQDRFTESQAFQQAHTTGGQPALTPAERQTVNEYYKGREEDRRTLMKEQHEDARASVKEGAGGAATVVNLPNGGIANVTSKEEATKLRDRSAAIQSFQESSNRVEQLAASAKAHIPGTQENRELQSEVANLRTLYMHAKGYQRPSEEAVRLADDAIGNPGALFSPNRAFRLKATAKALKMDFDNSIRASAASGPVGRVPERDQIDFKPAGGDEE